MNGITNHEVNKQTREISSELWIKSEVYMYIYMYMYISYCGSHKFSWDNIIQKFEQQNELNCDITWIEQFLLTVHQFRILHPRPTDIGQKTQHWFKE